VHKSPSAYSAEQVGPDGLARGIGHAHPTHAERIAQRPIGAQVAERIQHAIGKRYRRPVEQAAADAPGHAHEILEHAALDLAGILHADGHRGQQVFIHPRRREIIGRTDFAHVDGDRAGGLRAIDAKARDQRLCVGKNVLPDPRRRQVGQHLLGIGQTLEFAAGARAVDQRGVGMHHAFRITGGARGIEHRSGVARLALGDFGVDEPGVGGIEIAPEFLQAGKRHQLGLGVVSQAARIVIKDMGDLTGLLLDFQHLVDLLLILDNGVANLGILKHVDQFRRGRILIQADRNRAQRLRRSRGPGHPGPVGADDRYMVAALETLGGEPAGQCAHLAGHLAPVPRLPDAEILFADGRPLRAHQDVVREQARKGIRSRRGHAVHYLSPDRRCACRSRPDVRLCHSCGRHSILAYQRFRPDPGAE